MPKDLIVATILAVVAATVVWQREPRPEDWENRLAGLVFAYVLVLGWRLIAAMPTYGIIERFASDYRTANLRVPVAICIWLLFLLCVAGAVLT